ncbi:SDR family NAD(P)-dependent oxidoreductase [Oceanicoccus sagamiensis]|uniref:Oxidoreductase n=1 Tax=Oceanicoccus sagamiensis TaxID=716816 RepID=A0A1X9NDA3_9GAMM|nr:SDR family NAD(P)-dependent oxidoreductase [Oceanicoccus sagamiensis]ARN72937.1 hypothetical protein BST96_01740 [Oceanicoccus sagamiensis]
MARLAGKTAIITGASGTIGLAATKVFAEEGANVLMVARNEQALAKAAEEMATDRVSYVAADIATAAGNQLMVNTALERYGRLDIFYALAGIPGPIKALTEMTEEEWDTVQNSNIRGMWLGLREAMPVMTAGGSIILCSSGAGVIGVGMMSAYVTSKHAVIGLGRAAAIEAGARQIRVNTIAVGGVESPMLDNYNEDNSGEQDGEDNSFLPRIPLGRFSSPNEMAKAALFLASDDSSYCNGSVLTVDGGLTSS